MSTPRTFLLAGLAATVLAAAPAGAATPDTAARAADVVALGDSYGSGEGSADFGALADATDCHRSPNSLSAVAVASVDPSWVRTDATCSGALVGDLSAPMAVEDAPGGSVPPQLDALAALDPAGARFVTLSIGGNDAGFAEVLASCVIAGFLGGGGGSDTTADETCEARNPEVEPFLADDFDDLLAATYDSITDRLATVAEGWEGADPTRPIVVFVTDYPLIFPAEPAAEGCEQISASDVDWLNGMWLAANDTIAAEVAAADERAMAATLPVPVRFQHVPLGDVLDGHRLCEAPPAEPSVQGDDGSEWVNGLRLTSLLSSTSRPYAFHPNAAGHRAMGARLADAMRNPPTAEGAVPTTSAPASGGSSSSTTVVIVVVAAAAGLIAAGTWWFLRRRKA